MSSPGTAVVEHEQRGGFDLTRAPWRQWDKQMVELCKVTVLPQAKDDAEVYFCLAVADSLGLSPFAQEVFFIPQKARDGAPSGYKPYIGREGLVKKATERGAYFEADYVCEDDRFRMSRKASGERTVTHSYGKRSERGKVVGAYAFLYVAGHDVPAFFYADLAEYMPTFDADWKLSKSPWGNQLAAMIVKCAMVGAGRQRLNLSGALIDAEVDRFQQQQTYSGPASPSAPGGDFDFDSIEPEELRERLRVAVLAARDIDRDAWAPAKCEMIFSGRDQDELVNWAVAIEADNATRAGSFKAETKADDDADGPIVDAEVVDDDEVERLRERERALAEQVAFSKDADEEAALRAQLDGVRAELRKLSGDTPGQESLDLGE